MTTSDTAASGRIISSEVEREKPGSADCVMTCKQSGHVAYAVMSFGGFPGLGEKRHTVSSDR